MIESGFVTFLTSGYEALTTVLLRSVLEFSSKPIVVCGVGFFPKFPISDDRIIVKKLNDSRANGSSIYYQKFNCILNSEINRGIYVESDDIVNYKIDELFDSCPSHNFIVAPKHPLDPNNQCQMMQRFGVGLKTQPYVHGHILFSENSIPFISECYETALSVGNVGANWDETILNVLLWKYGRTDCITEVYDPYFEMYKQYLNGQSPFCNGYENQMALTHHMFHGCKNPTQANNIFEQIRGVRNPVHYTKSGTPK
jgi:hypothetical protein